MFCRRVLITALSCAITVAPTFPAKAAGEVLLTQAKAVQGGVTPGDTAGFPITISQPGSYALAGNLQPGSGRTGIVITAADVTIDLNGFRLFGANAALRGIVGSTNSVVIRNGSIRGFTSDGIRTTGDLWTIRDMQIAGNGGAGIWGFDAGFVRAQNNTLSRNGSEGIVCGGNCHVEGNNASANGFVGINVGKHGMVLGNTATDNTDAGIFIPVGGFGNNTAFGNNGGTGPQIEGEGTPMQPNACQPACSAP